MIMSSKNIMKFVLDTNVIIAAFITSGICHEILEHVIRNHKLVLSDFIVNEFKDKLLNKFQYEKKGADEALKPPVILGCK